MKIELLPFVFQPLLNLMANAVYLIIILLLSQLLCALFLMTQRQMSQNCPRSLPAFSIALYSQLNFPDPIPVCR